MAERNDWKECFEWVYEQVCSELGWAKDDLYNLEKRGYGESFGAEKQKGMIFAYESIKELMEKLDKHGYEGYKKICEETCKKYEGMG